MFHRRLNLGIRNARNSRDDARCERFARQARNRPSGVAQRTAEVVRGSVAYPGGHVEPVETLDGAMARELAGELGIVAGTYSVAAHIRDPSTAHIICHQYEVSDWKNEPRLANAKHRELKWFGVGEAIAPFDLALHDYWDFFKVLQSS
jgi:8-oxo-dGTP pyrophosphatase MutT (NUDIX family)